MNRRVVVTGVGLLTAVGLDAAESWQNLLAGKSGVAPITHFDTTGFAVSIAAEVKGFDPFQFIEKKELKKTLESLERDHQLTDEQWSKLICLQLFALYLVQCLICRGGPGGGNFPLSRFGHPPQYRKQSDPRLGYATSPSYQKKLIKIPRSAVESSADCEITT